MRIWIDLANSPHVHFFRPLIAEFERRGHRIGLTARKFAQTVELAHAAGLRPTVIGSHGGRRLSGKAMNYFQRAFGLARWARGGHYDLTVSHNSYEHILAARALGIRTVTLMDYEHNPANHLSFRLASRVIVPRVFPEEALRRYGAPVGKVRRYNGIKEDVYLADFVPDPHFGDTLRALGVCREDVLVVSRPPATFALYHRFENELFDELIESISARFGVKVILLPRTEAQRLELEARHTSESIIFPREALDGANLIAAADLVVSAGGTMNREAAALGVPAATIYAGKWAAIDEELVREGRLQRIASREDLGSIPIEKKKGANPRAVRRVRDEVVELILN